MLISTGKYALSFLLFFLLSPSTKLEIRIEQFLPGSKRVRGRERGWGGRGRRRG
jgi:hypothetical protein